MFKQFLLTISLLAATQSAALAYECEDQNAAPNKINASLERALFEAEAADADLGSEFILGVMKTTSDVSTNEEFSALFRDENVKIRAVIRAGNNYIVTFVASLSGVKNSACSKAVISIQMSQRLGGNAGVTIRN